MAENEDLGANLHLQSLDALAIETKRGVRMEDTEYVRVFENGVAVIDLIGAIYPRANMMTSSGATSISQFTSDFLKAYNDEDVSAIVMNIDSPGGDVRGIGDGAGLIKQAVDFGAKPVFSFAAGYMASAAYYAGSPAQRIFASRSALVGSIGVVLTARANEKGVIEVVSSISPNKRPDADKKEGRAILQEQVDDLGEIFVEDVSIFRGVSREKVLADYGQGAVKVGPRALAQGLVDAIGTISSVVELAANEAKGFRRGRKAKAQTAQAGHEAFELLQFSEDENMGLKAMIDKFKASSETVVTGVAPAPTTDTKSTEIDTPVVAAGTEEGETIGTDSNGEGFTQAQLDAAKVVPVAAQLPTRADLEERFADSAELFANNMTTDSRIWPAQAGHAASDLLTAKIDDVLYGGTVAFVDAEGKIAEGTREAAVRARYLAMPRHGLAQQSIEGIRNGSIVASVLAEGDNENVKTQEIMTPERRKQLLASSSQGQAVLAAQEAK